MVFTTLVRFAKDKGPDEVWRKRRIFKMAAHYLGRRRNCYSIAVRQVHRALQWATKARPLKKYDMRELRETRITAGAQQFGLEFETFREGLSRSNVMLNRKTLADLAIWEPKSFESLAMIARERALQDGLMGVHEKDHQDDRVVYHDNEQEIERQKYDGLTPANYSAKYRGHAEPPYQK